MSFIDLHTHSSFSDGTLTPAELFDLAREIGLTAVALTDHDSTNGLEEFMNAAADHPECEAVPGVELACSYVSREIHIVGLFIDRYNRELTEFLAAARNERARRNRDIRIKLTLNGYPLENSDLPPMPDDAMGRPHFAAALVKKYGFPDMRSVFEKVIGRNRPCYVPRRLPSPATAINAIHAAGGIAVWAHPISRDRNERAFLNRTARKLAALGLDAIEGYYSMFSAVETAMVTECAARHNLAISGGSDFHGANSPNIVLGYGAGGLRVPESLLVGLKGSLIH